MPQRADMESAPTVLFLFVTNGKTCCKARFLGGVKTPPYSTILYGALAPEGSLWEEYKAPLRKCSHSCIFRRFGL